VLEAFLYDHRIHAPIDHYVQLEICEQHLLYFALLLLGVESSRTLFGVPICACTIRTLFTLSNCFGSGAILAPTSGS